LPRHAGSTHKRRNPESKRYKEDGRNTLETLFYNRECASPDKGDPDQGKISLDWFGYFHSVHS
jgi:hypothetical protein